MMHRTSAVLENTHKVWSSVKINILLHLICYENLCLPNFGKQKSTLCILCYIQCLTFIAF